MMHAPVAHLELDRRLFYDADRLRRRRLAVHVGNKLDQSPKERRPGLGRKLVQLEFARELQTLDEFIGGNAE